MCAEREGDFLCCEARALEDGCSFAFFRSILEVGLVEVVRKPAKISGLFSTRHVLLGPLLYAGAIQFEITKILEVIPSSQ